MLTHRKPLKIYDFYIFAGKNFIGDKITAPLYNL